MIPEQRLKEYLQNHFRESRRRYNEFITKNQGDADWSLNIDFITQFASLALDDPKEAEEFQSSIQALGAAELAGRAALYATWWLYAQLIEQLNRAGLADQFIIEWEKTQGSP